MADANREIDSTVHEIHHACTHGKVNLHRGVAAQEIWQDRRDISVRKVCFNCYAQAARRRVRQLAHSQSRCFEIRDEAMRVLPIDLPRLGKTLLASRPMKETRTEFALQLGYLTRDRGGCDAKEARGR